MFRFLPAHILQTFLSTREPGTTAEPSRTSRVPQAAAIPAAPIRVVHDVFIFSCLGTAFARGHLELRVELAGRAQVTEPHQWFNQPLQSKGVTWLFQPPSPLLFGRSSPLHTLEGPDALTFEKRHILVHKVFPRKRSSTGRHGRGHRRLCGSRGFLPPCVGLD